MMGVAKLDFDVITNGAGPAMWDLVTNTMADVPEFWERVDGGPGAWTYDETLAGLTVLAEAANPDQAKFQNEIRKILGKLEREEAAIARRTAKIVNDYRNDILANVQWDVVTEWDTHRLAQLDRSMKRASTQFRQQMNRQWRDTANKATAMALAGVDGPMKIIGMATGAVPARLPTKALAIMNEYMPRLISDITEDTMKRVRREATMVMSGAKRPAAARAAIGGAIGDLEINTKGGKTYILKAHTRARNLMRTEFNRVNNLVSNQRIDQLAKDAGQGVGKKWLHRQSHDPRENHAALNGKVIWPADGEKFNVGGVKVNGPHDPALPAGESINCHCRVVVHVDMDAFKAAYKTPAERDKAKAAAKAKASGKPAPAAKSKPKKKPAVKPKPAKVDPGGAAYAGTHPDLATFEAKAINRKLEHAAVVDDNGGLVYKKTGTKSSVGFTNSELAQWNGRVVTHNHPNTHLKKTAWRPELNYPGSSFSWPDVKNGVRYHAREMRAVANGFNGEKWVHRIRPVAPGYQMDLTIRDMHKEFSRLDRAIGKELDNLVKTPAFPSAELPDIAALHEHKVHKIWTEMNVSFPWLNYERVVTP